MGTTQWIDTHVHLDIAAFAADREAVLERARAAGIHGLLVPAIRQAEWEGLQALARDTAEVLPAYGLHPMFLVDHDRAHLAALDDWLDRYPAVAVGEIGLDGYVPELAHGAAWDRQWAFFRAQLDIAHNHRLPVIIHARRALDQVLKALRQRPGLTGILHSFSGSRQQADQALDLGFVLGFGGPVTYPRAQRLRRLVAELPEDAFVLETDAPDQPPMGRQGERNEPAFLLEVAAVVAELRQVELPVLAQHTTRSARRILRLDGSGSEAQAPVTTPAAYQTEVYQERTCLLVGEAALRYLRQCHVMVAGLGGVGSFAAEALARAGVGRLTLLDHDVVGASNLNRQLLALRSTVGQAKVAVMAERIADIDPGIQVDQDRGFIQPDNLAEHLPDSVDFVVDCIDSIACKAALVAECQRRGVAVLSSMGAGGRLDPTSIQVGPLAQTQICPLARELRKRLRRLDASLDYPVVYSPEVPRKGTEHRPLDSPTPGRARSVNGTISYLPALFGLTAAGWVVQALLQRRGYV